MACLESFQIRIIWAILHFTMHVAPGGMDVKYIDV